jgi:hypothetical protein
MMESEFCDNCDIDREVLCHDCGFERFGDMSTPNELRRLKLRPPDNVRLRDKWLREYEAAGIGYDQDPSVFTMFLPTTGDAQDLVDRALDAAQTAFALRFSTPDDF